MYFIISLHKPRNLVALIQESWVCTEYSFKIKYSLFLSIYIIFCILCCLDLGTAGENVKRVKLYKFLRKHATGQATTELHIVHVERGMSWDEAVERSAEVKSSNEGFYLSHQVKKINLFYTNLFYILNYIFNTYDAILIQIRNNKSTAVLALMADNSANKKVETTKTPSKKDIMFTLFRPNTGLQVRL